MQKVLNEDNIFLTHELALVAALVAWNYPIVGLQKGEDRKVTFSFPNSPQLQEAIQAFWSNTKAVLPIRYFDALRMIKSRIYSEV